MNISIPILKIQRRLLLGLIMLFAALVSGQSLYAAEGQEQVARVSFLRGDATVIRGAETMPLKRGDTLVAGDTVETGSKSMVQLVFPDKQMFYVKADSSIKLEAFHFGAAADETADASVTELLKGGMRSISGLVGRNSPANVRYKAGETTIGIRGTAIEISHEPNQTTAVAFDYGKGYVEVDRPDLCIKTQMLRGNRLIINKSDVEQKALVRGDEDPSKAASSLVHATATERSKVAEALGRSMEFEDALFTLAMLRELPQFQDRVLYDTVTGMGRSMESAQLISLLMTASMLYPSEAPLILQAAAQSGQDMVPAVRGVMCGLSDESPDAMTRVVRTALDLGVTKEQAQQVLGDLQTRGCS